MQPYFHAEESLLDFGPFFGFLVYIFTINELVFRTMCCFEHSSDVLDVMCCFESFRPGICHFAELLSK